MKKSCNNKCVHERVHDYLKGKNESFFNFFFIPLALLGALQPFIKIYKIDSFAFFRALYTTQKLGEAGVIMTHTKNFKRI
jgi:hypothetical protein